MPFPDYPKIVYKKNPLDKVICQLRFPPILKIDTEIPSAFQERIRANFPLYSENREISFEGISGAKGAIPTDLLKQMFKPSENKNHEFSSEDEICKINLTRTFISMSVSKYSRWDDFKEKFRVPLNALIDIYKPAYFTRLGLRYIDVIKRSTLNLNNTSWHELLQPYVLGMLSSNDVNSNILNFENKYEIQLSDEKSVARIVTKFVESSDNGEICYSIDTDFFYTAKSTFEEAIDKLDYFSIRGARLMRWCVTDVLHEAMEPEKV